MDYDLQTFHASESGGSFSSLRLYSWLPACISIGYSQHDENEIERTNVKRLGWEIVQRPTGGGIVFHNAAEVTYSLVTTIDDPLFPKGLVPSYKKISQAVANGLKLLGINAQITNHKSPACRQARQITNNSKVSNSKFNNQLCFSFPAKYEIVVNGKKIVGSAQKRGRKAMLQQGSIFVRPNPAVVFSVLKKPFTPHNAVSVEEILGREIGFDELSDAVVKGFRDELGIEFS